MLICSIKAQKNWNETENSNAKVRFQFYKEYKQIAKPANIISTFLYHILITSKNCGLLKTSDFIRVVYLLVQCHQSKVIAREWAYTINFKRHKVTPYKTDMDQVFSMKYKHQ